MWADGLFIDLCVVLPGKRNYVRYLRILALPPASVIFCQIPWITSFSRVPPRRRPLGGIYRCHFGVFAQENNRTLSGSYWDPTAIPDVSELSPDAAFAGTDIRHTDAN